MWVTGHLDHRWGWDKLPKPLALLTLTGLRMTLRRENLHDTTGVTVGWGPELDMPPDRSMARTSSGVGTDPNHPQMGAAGTRFGRNAPPNETFRQEVLTPNPRTISNELLARKEFIPATTLNLLAASWIQFEVHDWMSHGNNDPVDPYEVELADDDPWPERPMKIQRTATDTTAAAGAGPPTYLNTETHWWDASQVYGSTPIIEQLIRTNEGGHVKLSPEGVIPFDPPNMHVEGLDLGAVVGNWWIGLAMMHTLWMREHNAICDHLAKAYPTKTDQELFDLARLINAALIARIHTVEWTPALLADSDMETGMNMNWWGIQGEALHKWLGRLTNSEEVSGIPGSGLYYHGSAFSMTEEFLAVYRMHPLIPDDYKIRSWKDDALIEQTDLIQMAGVNTHKILEDTRLDMSDLFYTFGTSNPGAIALHNYPNCLRALHEPNGVILDLAAVDILRSRERGVPRYNDFRRVFHMKPKETFEEFSDEPDVVEDLRRLYKSPDDVDLMIGLYTEKLPAGFAFSDTAFRVFIVMASRRLKSDRFFTYDYNADVYTREGLDWIEANTMKSVLLRHYPHLTSALADVKNAFKPWATATGS